MKTKNVFWGLFFIAAAGVIVLNQLGFLTGITLPVLVVSLLLLPIIVVSCARLTFTGIFFPLAVLGILFAEPLGIQNLVPWPILIVALFATIGFSIIFGHHKKFVHVIHHEGFDEVINTEDEDVVNFKVSFGSSIKYINSKNLKQANISCSFGALQLYLDTATISEEGAVINLDVSFSGVEIYVPRDWKIINGIQTTLAGVDEKYNRYTHDGPTITLKGNASLAGVEIIYV